MRGHLKRKESKKLNDNIMMKLEDFKEFEVKSYQILGGAATPTTHTTYKTDSIVTDSGGTYMEAGDGTFLGCRCSDGSFSNACC
jgi:hypothetical protein